jgi:hypothetical protein
VRWLYVGKKETTLGRTYVALSRARNLSSLIIEPMRYDRLSSIKMLNPWSTGWMKKNVFKELLTLSCSNSLCSQGTILCTNCVYCVPNVYIVFKSLFFMIRIVEDMDNAPGMTTLLRDNQLTNMLVLTMFFPCVPSILNTF